MFALRQRVEIEGSRHGVVMSHANGKVIVKEDGEIEREHYAAEVRALRCSRCNAELTEYNCSQILSACDDCLIHHGG